MAGMPLKRGLLGSSKKYAKISMSSDDEFHRETLSTTNTDSDSVEVEISASPVSTEVPADRSFIFDASRTTVFSEHYFLELREEALLGTGSNAIVRMCNEIHTGERMACKIISKAHLTQQQRQRVFNEGKIHNFLSGHPHVVKLEDVCEDVDSVYLIMKHCKGGDLLAMILKEVAEKDAGLPEDKAAEFMSSLAEFLSFSHGKGVVHRDLKPENILLDEASPGSDSITIKVADFGNAFQSIVSGIPENSYRRHFLGSHGYFAPEILRGERYGTAIDIWSAGVVLCNMLTGQMPFGREDYQDIIENRARLDFQRNDKWSALPTEAQHLIAGMLNLDPGARITADEICVHPWITEHAKKREAKAKRASSRKTRRMSSGKWSSGSSIFACFGGSARPHHS